MIEMISFLFAIGVGFGLSCLIFGSMLDKSNNIGDSRGSANDYRHTFITLPEKTA